MRQVLKRLLLLASFAAVATGAPAQEPSSTELAKIKKPEILEKARNGVSQDLVVSIDVSAIDKDYDAKRSEIQKKQVQSEHASSPADRLGINNDIASTNDSIVTEHSKELLDKKNSVYLPFASLGIKVVRDYPHSSTSLVTVPNIAALNALVRNSAVNWISSDELVKMSASWPGNHQDVAIIGAVIAANQGYTGKDMLVAMLDTGIDSTLVPAVQPGGSNRFIDISNAAFGPGFSGPCIYGPRPNPSAGLTGCSGWEHATVNAQIIAAVAPSAYIALQQVVDFYGHSNSDYVRNGLDYMIGMKESEASRKARGYWPTMVAVNISLALDPTSHYSSACPDIPIKDQLNRLISDGVVVVAAAGNDGSTVGVNSPACFPGVLSVGATYDSTTSYAGCRGTFSADRVACFSNVGGAYPAVYAPGVLIGGPDVYVDGMAQSGTSMAAPHVAAEVAILRQNSIGATKDVPGMIALIKANGAPVSDGSGQAKNRVDVSKAITALHPALKSITLTPASTSIFANTSGVAIYATAYDQAGNPMTQPGGITWASQSPSIATVDSTGHIQGVSAGMTYITAGSGAVSASAKVIVHGPATGVIDVPTNPVAVNFGETLTFRMVDNATHQTALIDPTHVAWASGGSAMDFAVDGATAEFTGLTPGIATVFVSYDGLTTQTTINVVARGGTIGPNPPNCSTNPRSCAVATPKPRLIQK